MDRHEGSTSTGNSPWMLPQHLENWVFGDSPPWGTVRTTGLEPRRRNRVRWEKSTKKLKDEFNRHGRLISNRCRWRIRNSGSQMTCEWQEQLLIGLCILLNSLLFLRFYLFLNLGWNRETDCHTEPKQATRTIFIGPFSFSESKRPRAKPGRTPYAWTRQTIISQHGKTS